MYQCWFEKLKSFNNCVHIKHLNIPIDVDIDFDKYSKLISELASIPMGSINRCNIFNIESNHKELFQKKQYMMVAPFIQALKLFINTPEKANKTSLDIIEQEGGLIKDRMIRDPRLIIFYSWLKGKYTNQPSSEVLIKEFSAL